MTKWDFINSLGPGERVWIFGKNLALATSYEFVGSQSIAYSESAAGSQVLSNDSGGSRVEVASGNAADTLAGTGAQKILVVGADPDGRMVYDEIDMAGQSSAFSANRYMTIYGAMVTQFGTGKASAGLIHVALSDSDGCTNTSGALTAPGPAIAMAAGVHMESNAIWACPPNEQRYELSRLHIGSSSQHVGIGIYVRPKQLGAWVLVCDLAKGNTGADFTPGLPLILDPGDVIRFDALSSTATGRVTVHAVFTPMRLGFWKRGGFYA